MCGCASSRAPCQASCPRPHPALLSGMWPRGGGVLGPRGGRGPGCARQPLPGRLGASVSCLQPSRRLRLAENVAVAQPPRRAPDATSWASSFSCSVCAVVSPAPTSGCVLGFGTGEAPHLQKGQCEASRHGSFCAKPLSFEGRACVAAAGDARGGPRGGESPSGHDGQLRSKSMFFRKIIASPSD